MRFLDLFAGLGGFHLALAQLGHNCVFASESNSELQDIYADNFGFRPNGDIRQVPVATIPVHEILCAGFPCQPFSKAGEQDGFDCPSWGDLFDRAVRILKHHEPEYVLLENVPNLLMHDLGRTWSRVVRLLRRAGYESDARILSPHQFGVPQIRERVYIVARRGGLRGFAWPEPQSQPQLHVSSVLEKNPTDAKPLTKQVLGCLKMWQRFIRRFPKGEHLPTFPIWGMEFGANYPYEEFTPASMKPSELRRYRGAYGKSLAKVPDDELLAALPPYARAGKRTFPDWKIDFIRKNRNLYHKNKKWIDAWKDEMLAFPPEPPKAGMELQGRRAGHLEICDSVSGVRCQGEKAEHRSVPHCDDGNASAHHRVGEALHDSA